MNPHIIITKLLQLTSHGQSYFIFPLALDYFEVNLRIHIISDFTSFLKYDKVCLRQKNLNMGTFSDNIFYMTNFLKIMTFGLYCI